MTTNSKAGTPAADVRPRSKKHVRALRGLKKAKERLDRVQLDESDAELSGLGLGKGSKKALRKLRKAEEKLKRLGFNIYRVASHRHAVPSVHISSVEPAGTEGGNTRFEKAITLMSQLWESSAEKNKEE